MERIIKIIINLSILIISFAIAYNILCINGIRHKSTLADFQTFTTVDLNLTSGNLWTTCNIGAINPWDYGKYYAWGETITKSYYDWCSYSHCNGTINSLTKYCNKSEYGVNGFTDTIMTLDCSDDATTNTTAPGFSIPTYKDWCELDSSCYWVWTNDYNGHSISGYMVFKAKSNEDKGIKIYSNDTLSKSYSMSDTHIFLPATGSRHKWSLNNAGYYGYYWSSTLLDKYPSRALRLYFDSKQIIVDHSSNRCNGRPIRAVKHK